MANTPKYLLCPTCGYTLSEETNATGRTFHCPKCGYRRDDS